MVFHIHLFPLPVTPKKNYINQSIILWQWDSEIYIPLENEKQKNNNLSSKNIYFHASVTLIVISEA